jgi:hypothetical protein
MMFAFYYALVNRPNITSDSYVVKDMELTFLLLVYSSLFYVFVVSVHHERDLVIRVTASFVYLNFVIYLEKPPSISIIRYNSILLLVTVLIETNFLELNSAFSRLYERDHAQT